MKNPILQFFNPDNADSNLRPLMARLEHLAHEIDEKIPSNAETATCLRRLLEARDCLERAVAYVDPKQPAAAPPSPPKPAPEMKKHGDPNKKPLEPIK